jgi:hypothetical protein
LIVFLLDERWPRGAEPNAAELKDDDKPNQATQKIPARGHSPTMGRFHNARLEPLIFHRNEIPILALVFWCISTVAIVGPRVH